MRTLHRFSSWSRMWWEFAGRYFSSFADMNTIQSGYSGTNFYTNPAVRRGSRAGYLGLLGKSPNAGRLDAVLSSRQRKSWANTASESSEDEDEIAPSELAEFLKKARVITKLRDILRENPWNADTIQLVNKFNKDLDTFVVAQLLKSGIETETAFGFFNWLKTLDGFSHTLHSYRSMIGSLVDAGRLDDMEKLVVEFRKFSSRSTLSLVNILQYYGRANSLEGALGIWNEMKKVNAKPTTESYNVLIDLLAQDGRYEESARMYLEMVEGGRIPNSRTYTVLIKHLIKVKKLDAALELFEKIPHLRVQSTVRQFSILIVAFARIGNTEIVKFLLNGLREAGHRLDCSVRVALQSLETADRWDSANLVGKDHLEELCAKVESNMCETDDEDKEVYNRKDTAVPWLNPNVLASVIKTWTHSTELVLEAAKVDWTSSLVDEVLRNFKKTETAWKFFCWVKDQPGFKHDTYTFSRMILIFAVDGDDQAVDFVLEQSKREGVRICIGTFNSIIRLHGTARKSVAAIEVFRKIESFGQKPNKVTYSTLIHSLVKSDNCTKALEILSEMQQAGYKPDVETYTLLMRHFGLGGNVQMAHLVFTWILHGGNTPDVHAYNTLIEVYCRAGDSEAALKLLKEMHIVGVTPTDVTRSFLVKSLLKARNYKEIMDLKKQLFTKVSPGGIRKVSTEDLMSVYDLYSSNLPGTVSSK